MIGDQRSDYNFYDYDCSFDELPPRILIRPIQSGKWFLCQRSGDFQSNFSKTVFRSSEVRHTFDILFCGFCIDKIPSKLEVAPLHSKMSEWTGWLGDTPETVTTTRAPVVLKSDFHQAKHLLRYSLTLNDNWSRNRSIINGQEIPALKTYQSTSKRFS